MPFPVLASGVAPAWYAKSAEVSSTAASITAKEIAPIRLSGRYSWTREDAFEFSQLADLLRDRPAASHYSQERRYRRERYWHVVAAQRHFQDARQRADRAGRGCDAGGLPKRRPRQSGRLRRQYEAKSVCLSRVTPSSI